jgi:hypothetical protein
MEENPMALGASLFLIAVGAVLAFAVTVSVAGIELVTVGWILMIVGAVGLVLSMLFWASFAPFGGARTDGTTRSHDHGHDVP